MPTAASCATHGLATPLPDEVNGTFLIDGKKYKYNVFQKQYNSGNGWKVYVGPPPVCRSV